MANYLEFESMSEGMEDKVKQNLKFKTGNFVWKIKFNVPLDPKTVNNVNLYVTSLNLSLIHIFCLIMICFCMVTAVNRKITVNVTIDHCRKSI